MKYNGTKKSGNDVDVYSFTVNKDELEILCKLVSIAYQGVPKTIDTMRYRGRLRNMEKELGRVFVEEIKGRVVSVKRVHKSIVKNLSEDK